MDEQVTFASSLLELETNEKMDALAKAHLIFLPTNDAFNKIEINHPNFYQWLRAHSNAMLRIMKGHVLHDCAQLITCLGAAITSVKTKLLELQFDKGRLQTVKFFNTDGSKSLESKVLPDVKCNLKSIVVIDRVLLPPDMVDILLEDQGLAPTTAPPPPLPALPVESVRSTSTAIVPNSAKLPLNNPKEIEPVQTRFLSDDDEEEDSEEAERSSSEEEKDDDEKAKERKSKKNEKKGKYTDEEEEEEDVDEQEPVQQNKKKKPEAKKKTGSNNNDKLSSKAVSSKKSESQKSSSKKIAVATSTKAKNKPVATGKAKK